MRAPDMVESSGFVPEALIETPYVGPMVSEGAAYGGESGSRSGDVGGT